MQQAGNHKFNKLQNFNSRLLYQSSSEQEHWSQPNPNPKASQQKQKAQKLKLNINIFTNTLSNFTSNAKRLDQQNGLTRQQQKMRYFHSKGNTIKQQHNNKNTSQQFKKSRHSFSYKYNQAEQNSIRNTQTIKSQLQKIINKQATKHKQNNCYPPQNEQNQYANSELFLPVTAHLKLTPFPNSSCVYQETNSRKTKSLLFKNSYKMNKNKRQFQEFSRVIQNVQSQRKQDLNEKQKQRKNDIFIIKEIKLNNLSNRSRHKNRNKIFETSFQSQYEDNNQLIHGNNTFAKQTQRERVMTFHNRNSKAHKTQISTQKQKQKQKQTRRNRRIEQQFNFNPTTDPKAKDTRSTNMNMNMNVYNGKGNQIENIGTKVIQIFQKYDDEWYQRQDINHENKFYTKPTRKDSRDMKWGEAWEFDQDAFEEYQQGQNCKMERKYSPNGNLNYDSSHTRGFKIREVVMDSQNKGKGRVKNRLKQYLNSKRNNQNIIHNNELEFQPWRQSQLQNEKQVSHPI